MVGGLPRMAVLAGEASRSLELPPLPCSSIPAQPGQQHVPDPTSNIRNVLWDHWRNVCETWAILSNPGGGFPEALVALGVGEPKGGRGSWAPGERVLLTPSRDSHWGMDLFS